MLMPGVKGNFGWWTIYNVWSGVYAETPPLLLSTSEISHYHMTLCRMLEGIKGLIVNAQMQHNSSVTIAMLWFLETSGLSVNKVKCTLRVTHLHFRFYIHSQKKRYKSCHWGCTFPNLHFCTQRLHIGTLVILAPKIYILAPEIVNIVHIKCTYST